MVPVTEIEALQKELATAKARIVELEQALTKAKAKRTWRS
jgi:hypothetical protein